MTRPGGPPVLSSKQTSISSFGRIAKPGHVAGNVSISNKKALPSITTGVLADEVATVSSLVSSKRKRTEELEDISSSNHAELASQVHKRAKVDFSKSETKRRFEDRALFNTPRKPRSNPQGLPTPESTPTKPRSTAPHSPTSISQDVSFTSSKTPRQRRGQLLLTDLKGLARTAQSRKPDALVKKTPPSHTNNQLRASNLLSRLQKKQVALANAPPPPTKKETARRGALQRVPDVVRILAQAPGSLDDRSQKQSWSLKSMVINVKQSARSVLGEDEIEECLKVIEQESEKLGCQGFVEFKSFGPNKQAVLVNTRFRPLHVEARVKEILTGFGG